MRCPRVLFAGGEHQDVAGGATGVEQQVDGLLGRVERAVGRSRDQLELRGRRLAAEPRRAARERRVPRAAAGGRRGRALRRGRGPRRGPGYRDAAWPRDAGRVRDGGSARCGRRPE